MEDLLQSGMPCSEFDALLSDAVEGKLSESVMQRFRAHSQSCGVCGPLYADALAGFTWLNSLVEVEPPANLVHNILAATSERGMARARASESQMPWKERLRAWIVPAVAPILQPRLAGTFAMAFFSLALMLNVLGIKASSVRHLDLRPQSLVSNVSHQFYYTQSRLVKYYDNLRIVYQVENTARDLRNALPADKDRDEKRNREKKVRPEQPDSSDQTHKRNKDRSQQMQDEEQFSNEQAQLTLAAWQQAPRTSLGRQATSSLRRTA